MKTLYPFLAFILLLCAFQTGAFAQSTNITETFKKHFSETVQEVHSTEKADDKRAVLIDHSIK